MKAKAVNSGFVIRLEKGEELIASLTSFAKDHKLKGGFITGLGGASKATLGYYELSENIYHFSDVDDLVEVVSLNGNLALKDDDPLWHVHGVFGKRDLSTIGGHIKSAIIAGTCEIFYFDTGAELTREQSGDVGLALLNCDE